MNNSYRQRAHVLLVALFAVWFGAGGTQAAPVILNGRIAFSHDGNRHDIDDWAASTMDLLMLVKAGAKSRLVHFDHCNHYCGNTPGQESIMAAGVNDRVSKLGFDSKYFFNDVRNLSGAVASIKAAVNASTIDNPLTFILAGPMEVAWQGLNAADPAKRKFVRCISHSAWNNAHPFESTGKDNCKECLKHDAGDIKALGVQWVQITDQNREPWMASSISSYSWMKTSGDPNIVWQYNRLDLVAKGYSAYTVPYRPDMSDAGMTYYALFGKDRITTAELQTFLKSAPTATHLASREMHEAMFSVSASGAGTYSLTANSPTGTVAVRSAAGEILTRGVLRDGRFGFDLSSRPPGVLVVTLTAGGRMFTSSIMSR